MPTDRICTDTVTLWVYAGEVDYAATYYRFVLSGVSVHLSRTVNAGGGAENTASLCIFDSNVTATSASGADASFLEASEWRELDESGKPLIWTLDGMHAGKDAFFVGTSTDTEPPVGTSYRITTVERYGRGTAGTRYWKAAGA